MIDPAFKKIQEAYLSKRITEAKDEFDKKAETMLGGPTQILGDAAGKKVSDIINKNKIPKPGMEKKMLRGRSCVIYVDKEYRDMPVVYILKKDKKFFDAIGAIKEEVEEDDLPAENQFGLTEDGWDEADLHELMDLLEDCTRIEYEIKNARRNSYAEFGDTMDSLIMKMEELSKSFADLAQDYMSKEGKEN